jgi:hypothetical protein
MVLKKVQDCNFKVVLISPDNSPKYTGRKLTISWMLQSIGFTNIEHYKSNSDVYPRSLVQANIEILKKYIDEPVLIVEDDIAYTDNCIIDLPEDADAFYLGLSECAGHPTLETNVGISQFEYVSPYTVRVKNMLAAHAVLYISRRYKEAIIKTLENCVLHNYSSDVSISRVQPLFNVYAGTVPMFYQSRAFNLTPRWDINVEDNTNIQIMIDDDKKCILIRRYGGKAELVKYKHELV